MMSHNISPNIGVQRSNWRLVGVATISVTLFLLAFVFLRFSAIPLAIFLAAALFVLWGLKRCRAGASRVKLLIAMGGSLAVLSLAVFGITVFLASARKAEARSLADQGKYEEAIHAFVETKHNFALSPAAFACNDEIAAAYFSWGSSLIEAQEYEDALAKFDYLQGNFSDYRQDDVKKERVNSRNGIAEIAYQNATGFYQQSLTPESIASTVAQESGTSTARAISYFLSAAKTAYEISLEFNPEQSRIDEINHMIQVCTSRLEAQAKLQDAANSGTNLEVQLPTYLSILNAYNQYPEGAQAGDALNQILVTWKINAVANINDVESKLAVHDAAINEALGSESRRLFYRYLPIGGSEGYRKWAALFANYPPGANLASAYNKIADAVDLVQQIGSAKDVDTAKDLSNSAHAALDDAKIMLQ